MTSKMKFHVPFFNETAKTASSKDSTLQSDLFNTQENAPRNIPRRRDTIWSDSVDEYLVVNLSQRKLNRQEIIFEIIKTENE
jgi:hypothetical protein